MTRLSNLIGATQTAPLTMAAAFATFAADGKYCAPIAITSVKDQSGADLPAQSSSCKDAVKPEVARGVAYAMGKVLDQGSGSLIRPALNSKNFPVAAKTGTNDSNGSTWVVGYTTGLATASWFGDPLGDQSRYGRNLTVNGKFYEFVDGYMIAGPQFTNYMLAVAPAYGTNPFQQPPSNLTGAPTPQRNNTPSNTTPSAPKQAPNPAPSTGTGNNGNGNGNSGDAPGKD